MHPPSPLAGEGKGGGKDAARYDASPSPAPPRKGEGKPPPLFPHSHVSESERSFAKERRRQQTKAETLIWRELRAHRLAGLSFRRQVPMGSYIADFVCHQAKLVVELDGDAHENPVRDRERDSWFDSRGYRTLRFRNELVASYPERVLEEIRKVCALRLSPLPDPPPQGGREGARNG